MVGEWTADGGRVGLQMVGEQNCRWSLPSFLPDTGPTIPSTGTELPAGRQGSLVGC